MKSYYAIYKGDIEKVLKENNIEQYVVLNPQLVVIYVDDDFDPIKFNNIREISLWNEASAMSSLIEITNNLDEGQTVIDAAQTGYIKNNPYTNIQGRNTLVAIIDSGVDYLHEDFIYKDDRKSKIVSIWDQESEKGNPPEGMIFGNEFTNEDINNAIKNNDNSLTKDNIGTGTIACGITSGLGNKNPNYRGIATESKLVVVKLRAFKGTYSKEKINYLETDFLSAIKYVIDISKRENLPLVINLTVASNSSTTETNILETFNTLYQPGLFIVSGAGNEGNTSIHYEGKFRDINDVQDRIIQVEEQNALDIIFEAKDLDKINAMLISPAGEVSYTIAYSPDYFVYDGKFNLENTFYSMKLTYPWVLSGRERIEIKLKDIKPGVWTLRLMPEFLINGGYDLYLPNKNLMAQNTRVIDPDSVATITTYAQGEAVITVGTYNDKTDSMWLGSSKGESLTSNIKPDIVAAGVDIISTYINNSYNTATGTGVSSSVVSGVILLIIEYLVDQSDFTRISLFTQVIKTYLMLGATKKDIYKYPNVSQGYGILDLKKTIEEIANNL